MRPEAYRLLAAREKTYWWHRARRKLARALLLRYGLSTGCRWLDLGCGPGGNLGMLDAERPARIAGIDISPIALSFARANAPAAELREADINQPLPFTDGSFDVVTIFNVLYHDWVQSEAAVLSEAARVLAPGGLLLVTEPAFASLAREMDDAVMGHRRYRRADFEPLLRKAGLTPCFFSYFTSFGYVILRIAQRLQSVPHSGTGRATAMDLRPINPVVNRLLECAARAEGMAIARGVRLPFGTTLICLARRV